MIAFTYISEKQRSYFLGRRRKTVGTDLNSVRTLATNEDWQLVTSPEYVLFHPCNITEHCHYFHIMHVFLKGILVLL